MSTTNIVRIVVASPGDTQPERDLLSLVVDELNRSVTPERNVRLELCRWETDAYPGFHAEGAQGHIDEILNVSDCDILIGIFWKRFGTSLNGQSGTEHELLLAYEQWKRTKRPQIMIYFNQKPYAPTSKEETEQWGQVIEFKRRFPKEGLWWSYKGKSQFERLVRSHLLRILRDTFPVSPALQISDAERHEVRRPVQEPKALANAYVADVVRAISKVYLLGDVQPRDLEKVFVELRIIERHYRASAGSELLGLMDAEMRRLRSGFARPEFPESNWSHRRSRHLINPHYLLRPGTRAVVTGPPGCGKTTLLRYLTAKTNGNSGHLPVFVELKTISDDAFKAANNDLTALLLGRVQASLSSIFKNDFDRLKSLLSSSLKAGTVAIFLDGLDELHGSGFFQALCTMISDFAHRTHQDNIVVLSARPYAIPVRIEGFREMEIAPLNWRQIEEFVEHYYGKRHDLDSLLRTFRQQRALFELMRVPFLLMAAIQLFLQQKQVSEDRLELYRQIVWQLVVQLDREKRLVRRDFRITDRNGVLKLEFLKFLAYRRLFSDVTKSAETARVMFTGDIILNDAREFCKATPVIGSAYDLAEDVKATPLLREVGNDIYAFTHLTIQEYLAAVELARHENPEAVFCTAYFNATLAGMEVLPMTLGLVSQPERLFHIVQELPESLNFAGLRLRVRALSYVTTIPAQVLLRITDSMLEFITRGGYEDVPFLSVVFRNLSEAKSGFLRVMLGGFQTIIKTADVETRRRLASAFTAIGPPALSALTSLLGDADEMVRRRAVLALGELGDTRTVTKVEELLLHDSDSIVRRNAAFMMGRIGNRHSSGALFSSILNDADTYVRRQAAIAYAKIGGEEHVNTLAELSNHHDATVRRIAATALSEIPCEQTDLALSHLLRDTNRFVRSSAVRAMAKVGGTAAIPVLTSMLNDKSPNVRWGIAKALSEIGSDEAVNILIHLSADKSSIVRWRAVAALGRIGTVRARERLVGCLADKVSYVRRTAIEALRKVGGSGIEEALLPLLQDSNPSVRGRAAIALGHLGRRELSSTLVPLLSDRFPSVRQRAVTAYINIAGGDAIGDVLPLITDSDPGVRQSAAEALRDHGDDRAVDVLIEALVTDQDSDVRQVSALALGKIGGHRAAKVLFSVLNDEDVFVRRSAGVALGYIHDGLLASELVIALSNSDEIIRQKATQFVAYYSEDIHVLDTLTRMAKHDESDTVRNTARDAANRYARKLSYFGFVSSPDNAL